MDLSSLATSLQTSTRLTKAEKDLMEKFRAAALSITTLYKSSLSTSKRAYSAGYSACLSDVLQMIQHGLSTEHGLAGEGLANPMTIGRVMDWVEARQETIRLEEEEGDDEGDPADGGGGSGLTGGGPVAAGGTGRTTTATAANVGERMGPPPSRSSTAAASSAVPPSSRFTGSSSSSSSRQAAPTRPPPPSPPPAIPPPTAFANAAASSSNSTSQQPLRPAFTRAQSSSSSMTGLGGDRPARRLASSPVTPGTSSPLHHHHVAYGSSTVAGPSSLPASPSLARRKQGGMATSSLSQGSLVPAASGGDSAMSASEGTSLSAPSPASAVASGSHRHLHSHVPQSDFSFHLAAPSGSPTIPPLSFGPSSNTNSGYLGRLPPLPMEAGSSSAPVSVPAKRRFATILPSPPTTANVSPATTSAGGSGMSADRSVGEQSMADEGVTSSTVAAPAAPLSQAAALSRRKGRRGGVRPVGGGERDGPEGNGPGGVAEAADGGEREKKRVARR